MYNVERLFEMLIEKECNKYRDKLHMSNIFIFIQHFVPNVYKSRDDYSWKKYIKYKYFILNNYLRIKNSYIDIFIPQYKIFNKSFDIISYTGYDGKFLNHMLSDFKFKNNLSIVKKKIFIRKINKINHKIDLIKIDTNGHELSIINGLLKFIKRDKPALIVEENYDSNKIMKLLKRFSYKGYYYSISKRKFELKRNKGALNRYYLQDKHLKI